MPHPLEPFFIPRGIAVVGVSEKPGKLGGIIWENLKRAGFRGALHAVNPRYPSFGGAPCYPSLREVPDPADLAVLAVPAPHVPEVLQDQGARGIRHAVIISGGFAEAGPEGTVLQAASAEIARAHGIRVIGPNCLGIYAPGTGIDTLFLPRERLERPDPGGLAILSQSGAFLSTLLDLLAQEGLGVSKAVNYGNRIDVGESPLLEYLSEDPETRVVAIYMESVDEGRRFVAAAARCSRVKPVLVVKVGKTEAAGRAARSHTAALAGRHAIYRAAFRKAGVVEVASFEALLDGVKACLLQPPPRGKRVLIITNGGGMGVAAVDRAAQVGLEVPDLPEALAVRWRSRFPPFYTIGNPLDLTGNSTDEDFATAIQEGLADPSFDAALVIALTPVLGLSDRLAERIARAARAATKPLVCCSVGGRRTPHLVRRLHAEGIPVFPSPERAADALAVLARGKP
jgi:acyl-CoA synthetase (NDP forming)